MLGVAIEHYFSHGGICILAHGNDPSHFAAISTIKPMLMFNYCNVTGVKV